MNCSSCLNNCNTTGKVTVNSCVCWTFVPLEPVWCSWEWLVPDLSSLCVGEQQVEDGREKTGASWFSLLRNTLFPQFHTWPRWARRGRRERARPAPSLVGYLLVLRTGCEGGEREHNSVSLTHTAKQVCETTAPTHVDSSDTYSATTLTFTHANNHVVDSGSSLAEVLHVARE